MLDITNDPNWLLLRLESFTGRQVPARATETARDSRLRELGPVLIDRVVLWVDGHEIRPQSAEYIPPTSAVGSDTRARPATFRLRGRMPSDARTLRWMYGSVADPYPLIMRRADGRTHAEVIDGSNWSGTIDLSGQFKSTRFAGVDHIVLLVGFFALTVWLRARGVW